MAERTLARRASDVVHTDERIRGELVPAAEELLEPFVGQVLADRAGR